MSENSLGVAHEYEWQALLSPAAALGPDTRVER